MTISTLCGAKMHCESTKPENHQTAKMFFFISSSPSSSSSFFSFSSASSSSSFSSSSSSSSSSSGSNRSLNNHGFISNVFFMHTSHLAKKVLLFKNTELVVVCMKTGRVSHPLLIQCLNGLSLVNDPPANTAYRNSGN